MNDDTERVNDDVLRTGRVHWTIVSCPTCGSTETEHKSTEAIYRSTGQRREYKHHRSEFVCQVCKRIITRTYEVME